MSAYLLEELSTDEDARLQDHVALCRVCLTRLVDLQSFAEPAPPSDPATWEAGKRAAWKELWPRLQQASSPPEADEASPAQYAEPAPRPEPVGESWVQAAPAQGVVTRWRLLAAVAAGLLGLTVGLSFWLQSALSENRRLLASLEAGVADTEERLAVAEAELSAAREAGTAMGEDLAASRLSLAATESALRDLEQRRAGLDAPQLVVPSVDLYPRGFVRSRGEGAVVRVPPGTRVFTVTLFSNGLVDAERYRLRILDSRGQELWAGGASETPPSAPSLTVAIFTRFLPQGDYRLRLEGARGGEWSVLETYPLRVAGDS